MRDAKALMAGTISRGMTQKSKPAEAMASDLESIVVLKGRPCMWH